MKNNTDYIVESYKSNFSSPLGAYCYLLLNQQYPELFVISSNSISSNSNSSNNKLITENLEVLLKSTTDYNELISSINSIDNKIFQSIESSEQIIDKKAVLSLLENVQYLNIEHDWNILSGIIDYNNYSAYLVDKNPIIEKMQILATTFSMNSVSLNPNYHADEFLDTMYIDLHKMCKLANIEHQHIGLNVLNLNYQTEEGDFSGYVQSIEEGVSSKMVIKKTEVFFHEWIHFIDSCLGKKGHTITSLLDLEVGREILVLDGLENTVQFEKKLYNKSEEYSSKDFSQAIASLGYFLEKYAINKESFYTDLKQISSKFINNTNEEHSQENMIKDIKTILSPNFPPRYFSFINAQCEIYIDKINNNKLASNQLVSFSEKADKHLGEENYTVSLIETFARTAEAYFFDEGQKKDIKLKLLASSYESDFSPQGKLREQMNEHWEKSWSEIRNQLYKLNSPNFMSNNIQNLRKKQNAGNDANTNLKIA